MSEAVYDRRGVQELVDERVCAKLGLCAGALFLLVMAFLLGMLVGVVVGRERERASLQKRPNGEHSAHHREESQKDVEPEKLNAETAGGALVPVDRVAELFDELGSEGAFDFLMQPPGRFGGGSELLDELGNGVSQLGAGLVFGAHDLISIADGATVKPEPKPSTQEVGA